MLQAIANGLTLGLAYAMLAAGFALLYGVMGVLNFAHGELVTVGAYVVVLLGVAATDASAYLLAILLALVLGLVGGVAVDQGIFRPLRTRSPFAVLLSTIGISLITINSVALIAGDESKSLRTFLTDRIYRGAGVAISGQRIAVAVIALTALGSLYYLLMHTDVGRRIRAVAEDIETARLTGINTERVMMSVTAISFMMATLAGALVAPLFSLTPTFGLEMLLRVFAIVVIGGLGSLTGAVFAALLLGLVESIATFYLSPAWVSTYIFGVLVVVLVVRPEGLARAFGGITVSEGGD